MSATPYADEAFRVLNSGLGSPVPVTYGQKREPVAGWTGRLAPYADAGRVGDWIVTHGTSNVALRVADGVLGLDVDSYKPAAALTLSAFEEACGELPPTVVSTSRDDGSGIRWYRVAAGRRWPSELGEGVEVIHPAHRYAMWRGSLHPDGGTYRLDDRRTGEVDVPTPDVASLPWLTEAQQEGLAAQQRQRKAEAGPYDGPTWDELEDDAHRAVAHAEAEEGIERVLERLREMWDWPEGHVDDLGRGWEKRTADAAQSLRTLAAEGWSDHTEAELYARFLAACPPSARGGTADPVERWRSQAGKHVTAGGRIEHRLGLYFAPPPRQPSTSETRLGLDWSTFFDDDDTEPVWIAGQLAEQGQQVALVGSGKVGKSLLCLEWAGALAAGRSFLGDVEREPVTVLYVDKENPQRDIRRRFRALGFDDPASLGRLHYLSFPVGHGPLDTAAGAAALLADVRASGAGVVFLDTVSRMIEGKEDAADTWLALYRYTLEPLKGMGVTVVRLDHFGKDAERGARGSSAKTQDVDQVWELTASTKSALRLRRTHSRTGLGDDDIAVTRTGESGEVGNTRHLRSLSFEAGSTDPTVLNAVRQLEEAGCPPGLGRDRLKTWAKDHGVGLLLRNDTWSQVAKERGK